MSRAAGAGLGVLGAMAAGEEPEDSGSLWETSRMKAGRAQPLRSESASGFGHYWARGGRGQRVPAPWAEHLLGASRASSRCPVPKASTALLSVRCWEHGTPAGGRMRLGKRMIRPGSRAIQQPRAGGQNRGSHQDTSLAPPGLDFSQGPQGQEGLWEAGLA